MRAALVLFVTLSLSPAARAQRPVPEVRERFDIPRIGLPPRPREVDPLTAGVSFAVLLAVALLGYAVRRNWPWKSEFWATPAVFALGSVLGWALLHGTHEWTGRLVQDFHWPVVIGLGLVASLGAACAKAERERGKRRAA
ncbi:MAG: hypothetical protein K2W96_06865 [Gemmataceae bacterium]|nr:hypothetical protein [Gemmataceae bacterium]